MKRSGFGLLMALALFASGTLRAQSAEQATPVPSTEGPDIKVATDATTTDIDGLQQALKQLKTQLDAQNKQITQLQSQYESAVTSRQQEIDKQRKVIKGQTGQLDTQRQAIQALQQQVDKVSSVTHDSLTQDEKELRSRLETIEGSIKSSQQAESTSYDIHSFPGSIPIPGTSAGLKMGGYVKMNIVESFDPIGTADRFIVGSIPVPQESGQANANLTVSPSRLNIDLRDTTKAGPLRAFIEADFAGTGDSFRLRHAFGQFKNVLIGKTWSTFMDIEAKPEELDFEGINGQILLRQPQIRYFPKIGQDWHLLTSLEDPNPRVSGGDGISQIPDFVISVRRTWFDKWHVKSALLIRQLKGMCSCLDDKQDSTTGWGLNISGKTALSRWDDRDNLMFQLNYGKGYGRYVNDLKSIGQADAIFDQTTGKLKALSVFSMYFALQKWWTPSIRSNFTLGFVSLDNISIQGPSEYHRTARYSMDAIWSPTARVDLGVELLYGKRENKDAQKASAKQLQLSAKYRF
jgi:hypothetical protein